LVALLASGLAAEPLTQLAGEHERHFLRAIRARRPSDARPCASFHMGETTAATGACQPLTVATNTAKPQPRRRPHGQGRLCVV
jgi:hypothetical protein